MDEKLSILEFQLLDSFRTISEKSIVSAAPGKYLWDFHENFFLVLVS